MKRFVALVKSWDVPFHQLLAAAAGCALLWLASGDYPRHLLGELKLSAGLTGWYLSNKLIRLWSSHEVPKHDDGKDGWMLLALGFGDFMLIAGGLRVNHWIMLDTAMAIAFFRTAAMISETARLPLKTSPRSVYSEGY